VGYVGNNAPDGITPTIQWHELQHELANGRVLVDVRTDAENARGTIPGAINLKVDSLREHLDELEGQQVVITCQVGHRGHIAAQILRAHGIDVVSLSRGYITWKKSQDALAR